MAHIRMSFSHLIYVFVFILGEKMIDEVIGSCVGFCFVVYKNLALLIKCVLVYKFKTNKKEK